MMNVLADLGPIGSRKESSAVPQGVEKVGEESVNREKSRVQAGRLAEAST
ncbi:hypothetical protein Emed_006462 [Eimeria media]